MLRKITWDDIEVIEDDSIYDKCLEDETYIDTLIADEIKYLIDQGIEVVKQDKNYIIVNGEINPKYKIFPTTNIHEVDENFKIIDQKAEKIDTNMKKINNIKAKIIVNYFKINNIQVRRVLLDKNIITFDCPMCGKNNEKMYIFINSFSVRTHSANDCMDEKHQKRYKKWKSDLKKLWSENKEKSTLVFNMSKEYIEKVVKENFPTIIKEKTSHTLFKYDEAKKCYVEMIDNELHSDLETLILENFFEEGNTCLSCNQLRDVKKNIMRWYPFPIKEFESCDLLNCKNGVFNMITNELKPHSKDYFFNYCSNIEYNPNANSKKLNDFIKSVVTEERPIELISRVLGHIHYQGEKLQKGFMFKGTKHGRNGKGTLVKLIREVIGMNRTVTMGIDTFQDNKFAEYDLKDKVLYIEDDYKADYIDSKTIGLLNRMISGVETQVNQKNKPAIKIKYTCVPLIQCNKVPKLKADDDGGFYARWVIVNFENEFGEADTTNEWLGSQLLNDSEVMSTMLNHLISGYKQLLLRKENNIRGNFFKDDDKKHIEEWKIENSSPLQFFNECCELNANYKVFSTDLYLAYKNEWNLGSSKMGQNKFTKILKEEYNLKTGRDDLPNKKKTPTYIIGLKCELVDNDITLNTLKGENVL